MLLNFEIVSKQRAKDIVETLHVVQGVMNEKDFFLMPNMIDMASLNEIELNQARRLFKMLNIIVVEVRMTFL